jgi:SAM-dependent methyltransferase
MKISFAMSHSAKEWSSPQTALTYLNLADAIPHRSEGESVLIDHLPEDTKRILDLGTGDGRLIRLIKANRPEIETVAIDVSPTMLKSAREHFANDSKIMIIEHDFSQPLPEDLGYFDAVVSSFAIHHLRHECKRELYEEIYDIVILQEYSVIWNTLYHFLSNCMSDFLKQLDTVQKKKIKLIDCYQWNCNWVG